MTAPYELRPYQQGCVSRCLELYARRVPAILCAPTGSGKTVMAARVIEAVSASGPVLVVAHRRELVDQLHDHIVSIGVPCGIHDGTRKTGTWLPVKVASIQSLARKRPAFQPAAIVFDEAHHVPAASYARLIEDNPGAWVFGLTATPVRTDGRGLGDYFQVMATAPGTAELAAMGFLSPARVFAGTRADTKGISRRGGDFALEELAERAMRPSLIGDIVSQYRRIAPGRAALAYGVNVGHSMAIRDAFLAAGIPAAHLDGESPAAERRGALEALRSGEIAILSNCGLFTEGYDAPGVSAVINARDTESLGLWLQICGRGMRPAPGKPDCIILDHTSCWKKFGTPMAPRAWELTCGKVKVFQPLPRFADAARVCPTCGAVSDRATPVCACGYKFRIGVPKLPRTAEGSLEEVTSHPVPDLESARRLNFDRWAFEQRTRRRKDGSPFSRWYAYQRYKHRYGLPPPREWLREARIL